MHENKPRPSHIRSVFRTYYRHMVRYPWLLLPVCIGTIGVQVAELISPLYLRRFFNVLATHTPDAAARHQLITLIGIIALVSLCSWAMRRIQTGTLMRLESRVMADLVSTAFTYLIGHSYNFFISHFAGSLTHRVNRFSRAFESMYDAFVLQFIPTLLYVVGAIVILFSVIIRSVSYLAYGRYFLSHFRSLSRDSASRYELRAQRQIQKSRACSPTLFQIT